MHRVVSTILLGDAKELLQHNLTGVWVCGGVRAVWGSRTAGAGEAKRERRCQGEERERGGQSADPV